MDGNLDKLVENLLPFLAILNPFALCLYLVGVMEDLNKRQFLRVLAGACAISLVVFWLSSVVGEPFLNNVMKVEPESVRIFGGIIFFVVGYNYAVKGYKASEMLRGSLEELPSVIALPFMIGAGTITQSIFIGKQLTTFWAFVVLAVGISINFAIVLLFKFIRDHLKTRRERLFDRWVNILARINGLLIGSISIQMIIESVHELWLAAPSSQG